MLRLKIAYSLLALTTLTLAACSGKSSSDQNFTIPQSPLLSAFERKSGLISYIGSDGNVYVMDQAGKNSVQITKDGSLDQNNFNFYQFPTWSRDGQSLAFFSLKGTSQIDVTASVFTSDLAGKNVVSAYTTDRNVPIYLSWSPDSSKVAFISNLSGSNNIVFNMIPSGGGEAQVLDIGAPFYWDWLPDGSGVMVHSGGPSSTDTQARLSLLTLTDGVVEDTLSLKPGLFRAPALSPDGSKALLAVEDDQGKSSLVITDRLGKVESTITALDGSVSFSWSPDGKYVAYVKGDPSQSITVGKLSFAEVAADGTVKNIDTDQDQVVAFFWAPDSSRVVDFVLGQADLPTATPNPDPQATPAADSTNGGKAYYLKMYVAQAASGSTKVIVPQFSPSQDFWNTIPYFDQYSRSGTIWSPDGQYIVVGAYAPDGNPGIYVVPSSGITGPRYLIDGTMPFWSSK